MDNFCEEHTKQVFIIARVEQKLDDIKLSFEEIKSRMVDHINEGERPGGIRERVFAIEKDISALKKAMWARVSVAGVIGGLIGAGSADAVIELIKWIMK